MFTGKTKEIDPSRASLKHALVTGGGGFLGFALVKQLLAAGYRVRSFARQHYVALDQLGVESVRGDLARAADVQRAVRGVDIVFHVAARAGVWGKRQLYYVPNVIGTQHVVEACLQHKVKYLIYTGSPSVTFTGQAQEGVNEDVPYTQKFFCAYQETKTIAEQYVLQNRHPDLYTLALRPHLIWGVGDPHFFAALAGTCPSPAFYRRWQQPHRYNLPQRCCRSSCLCRTSTVPQPRPQRAQLLYQQR